MKRDSEAYNMLSGLFCVTIGSLLLVGGESVVINDNRILLDPAVTR